MNADTVWNTILVNLNIYNGLITAIVGIITLLTYFCTCSICCIVYRLKSKYSRLSQKIHPVSNETCHCRNHCQANSNRMMTSQDYQDSYKMNNYETHNGRPVAPQRLNAPNMFQTGSYEADLVLPAATYVPSSLAEANPVYPKVQIQD